MTEGRKGSVGTKNTWLVTGGAGYIGSHVARLLDERGLTVLVIDSLDTGIVDRLPKSIELRVGHVSNIAKVYPDISPGSLSGIVHLAGLKNARESHAAPLHYWQYNVGELIPFMGWAVEQEVPNFIFSSSSSVYGPQSRVSENSDIRPISPYGRTKATGEAILRDLSKRHGFALCSLRYFNVVGCDTFALAHDTGLDNVVPRFVEAGLGSNPMQIYGTTHETPDGTCLRDYVDVRDLAEAHACVADRMLSGQSVSQAINVGTGIPSSVLDVAHYVSEVVNLPEIAIKECAAHPADPPEVGAIESSDLKSWGWSPHFTLKTSIQAHVDSVVRFGDSES